MTVAGDLKKVLSDMKSTYGVEAGAVVSRNGIPISWELPENVHVETFSTLSATILGASDVVCSSLEKDAPDRVIIQSKGNTIVITGLGSKALLVAMANSSESEKLVKGVDESASKIKEVLKNDKGA
jgi:predicted regulator of Ras-like GTPase activity (Roadblock/LC7/MglB family)